MRNIAIIPARSGSKGIPDKNIRLFGGKPLFAHTIIAAVESGMFDEVMVSTDSESYAVIAKQYGAAVPFLRSAQASSDSASSWAVVSEVLDHYRGAGHSFDSFCLLQPTSPLRGSTHIREAYSLLNARGADAVISVCPAEHSPFVFGVLGPDGSMGGFVARDNNGARQLYGPFFRINGAIYIAKTLFYSEDTFLYREGSYAYIMSSEDSVDIDTELDFRIAEELYKGRDGVCQKALI